MKKSLRLYGVITKAMPEGRVALCSPVFVEYWDRKPIKYYRLIVHTENHPADADGFESVYAYELKEIDISLFGKPQFLPLSMNKVGDGQDYLVIFQRSKSSCAVRTINNAYLYDAYYEKCCGPKILDEMFLNIGIEFPNKFIIKWTRGCIITNLKAANVL